MVKPRYGFGSVNLFKAYNFKELEVFYRYIKDRIRNSVYDFFHWDKDFPVIIQEYIEGREYGIEVVNDLKGNYLATFKKLKFEMRSGETDGAEIIENKELEKIGQLISNKLPSIGLLDIDVVKTNRGFELLEINPRFGGQYPFSHMAGANLPKLYLDLYQNKKVNPRYLKLQKGKKFLKDIKIKEIY
jgi:carbamoyl-phosphate synthase large subunit